MGDVGDLIVPYPLNKELQAMDNLTTAKIKIVFLKDKATNCFNKP